MLDIESARLLEESLLDPAVRGSGEDLSSLIADGFVEFGSSGRVFGKQDVLDAAEHLPDVDIPLEDFRTHPLGLDAVLVTYRSTTRREDGSTLEALRSSVWVFEDGRWQMIFHQGTPAESLEREGR